MCTCVYLCVHVLFRAGLAAGGTCLWYMTGVQSPDRPRPSRRTAHGSRLTADGSRLTADGSRLTAHEHGRIGPTAPISAICNPSSPIRCPGCVPGPAAVDGIGLKGAGESAPYLVCGPRKSAPEREEVISRIPKTQPTLGLISRPSSARNHNVLLTSCDLGNEETGLTSSSGAVVRAQHKSPQIV